LESAVNIIPEPEEPSGTGEMPTNVAPGFVAREVAVTATGARPSEVKGQRDLFSEETATTLVSENGAVIRLSAAVVTGQLLFLTEKKNNREVVCQVVRKRNFRPTICYVELEFTEPVPDFWGLEFPNTEPATAPATAAVEEAVQMVESAELATDEEAQQPGPVSGLEVLQLKSEVEALKNQLKTLLQNGAGAATVAAPPGNLVQAKSGSEATVLPEKKTGPAETPPQQTELPATAPVIAMSLPTRKGEEPAATTVDPLDDFLPKPALDFSVADAPGKRSVWGTMDTRIIPKRGAVLGRWLQFVLVLVLFSTAFGVFAWKMDWLKIPVPGGVASIGNVPKSQPAIGASAGKKTGDTTTAQTVSPTPKETALDGATGVAAVEHAPAAATDSGASGTVAAAAPEVTPKELPAENAGVAAKASKVVSVAKRAGGAQKNVAGTKKRSHEDSSAAPELAVAAETSAVDGALAPPKLLKAATPVYPPDAMRNYITGDVKVDAVVEPNGSIGAMKILTGPAPLRDAAMDALRQYEYAPATQGGKPVAAHVTVTVKFWFNP